MKLFFAGILSLVLGLSVTADGQGQERTPGPAEQYQALLKELQNVPDDLANAQTDAERSEVRARLATLPLRLLSLAEEYPQDPVALEALIQTVAWVNGTAFPAGGEGSPGERALALLLRDHKHSEKLGTVCQQIAFGFHKSHETFLRAVLEMNPHREVEALACLSLAQFLNDRLNRLSILQDQDQPEITERYHRAFGEDYLEELIAQDRAAVAQEAERLFARAAEEFADVDIPVTYYGSRGTVGEKANAELFQIRNLAVGKVAPDIEGQDQDGVRFRLSDYRGKVVLLDIWYHL